MKFYEFLLAVLCVWRLTHLLNKEDGPWGSLAHFRRFAGNGFVGELLDCFYCLSLWIAAPVTFLLEHHWKERLLTWTALSAGAILLERVTTRPTEALRPFYFEDREQEH